MTDRTGSNIVVALLGATVFFFIVYTGIQNNDVERGGVYILGKLQEIITGGESGPFCKYSYTFKGRDYTWGFGCDEPGSDDSLIFLKILPDHPEVCRQITTPHVPRCLRLGDVPKDGWAKLPPHPCN